MRTSVLASGSRGNSTYIGTNTTNILIDLGPTTSYIETKLKSIDVNPSDIKAILITHTHTDHTNGLKVFVKKYHPTLYLTQKMYEDIEQIFHIYDYVIIEDDFTLDDLNVGIIKTSHDASDSNGYIVSDGTNSVVYITDTGYINEKYYKKLYNKNVYIMESNHDVEMLMNGKYPYQIRRRILSDRGHLSNIDSATYLTKFIGPDTNKVILAHLSGENNDPTLAVDTLKSILKEHDINFDNIVVATQDERTELIEL